MYKITSTQKAPHESLDDIVKKHCETAFQKPISKQQQTIFESINEIVTVSNKPIILDSGCGTGKSSQHLAEIYPNHLIIGIDKSEDRLQRNAIYRSGGQQNNLYLVRADLIDFWRLAAKANWPIEKHYLLYPNPYPKKNDITKRWHAHPVFPYLMQLGKVIEVRSNWDVYIQEFEQAAILMGFEKMSSEPEIKTPISAFEKKYQDAGEVLFKIVLDKKRRHD